MQTTEIYSYVRQQLREFEGMHLTIAKESGVSQTTISRIHNLGDETDPRISSIQPLIDWFEANQHRKPKSDARGRA